MKPLLAPLLVGAMATALFAPATASASTTAAIFSAPAQAQTTPAEEHCVIVVKKDGSIVSQACADDPHAPALRQTSVNTVLLLELFEDAHFEGSSRSLRGADGPCDSAGYGFSTLGPAWNNRVSSFRAFNNCTSTTGYFNTYYGGTSHTWNTTSVSGMVNFNDNIESLWTKRG